MAAKKSSQYPYKWPDGTWHSRPPTPNLGGYSPGQINTLNGIIPGGSGVQGVAGVTDTPGGGDLSAIKLPPHETPQQPDPAFENAKLGASWNIQTADAESGWQRGETAWGTGYNADGSLNTSNPYSQAMLLQDNYKRSITGTNNGMAAAGQLYSGARLNAQAHNDRTYAEGSSALKDSARKAYHGIDYGQLQTYGSNSLGVSGESYNALHRAVYGGS